MRNKGWVVLCAAVAVLALVWFAAAPLFAFKALANAGQAGDRNRLAALVDFPAVREDLKVQLSARLEGALSRDKGLSDSPFGALGALIAPTVVDQVVDAAVTPEGVAAIVRSGRAPMADVGRGKSALPPPEDTAAPVATPGVEKPQTRTRFAYTGFNSFKATTTRGDSSIGWVMGRRGLGWKLARIELPS